MFQTVLTGKETFCSKSSIIDCWKFLHRLQVLSKRNSHFDSTLIHRKIWQNIQEKNLNWRFSDSLYYNCRSCAIMFYKYKNISLRYYCAIKQRNDIIVKLWSHHPAAGKQEYERKSLILVRRFFNINSFVLFVIWFSFVVRNNNFNREFFHSSSLLLRIIIWRTRVVYAKFTLAIIRVVEILARDSNSEKTWFNRVWHKLLINSK